MAPDASLPPCQSRGDYRLTIQQLKENHLLWYKLHVFMYDLRNFRSKEMSRNRLDCVIDDMYIGEPYFTADEHDKLRRTITHGTDMTLEDLLSEFFQNKLEKRIQGRIKATGDWRICAAHDLAPIIERAFRVNSKDLSKNKMFVKLVQRDGLQLREGVIWQGLGKS